VFFELFSIFWLFFVFFDHNLTIISPSSHKLIYTYTHSPLHLIAVTPGWNVDNKSPNPPNAIVGDTEHAPACFSVPQQFLGRGQEPRCLSPQRKKPFTP
jgi:hypothetical protein